MNLLTFILGSSTRSWQPATSMDTTAASYWLNWRVLLCSVWILMSIVFAAFLISKNESSGHGSRESSNSNSNSNSNSSSSNKYSPSEVIVYEDQVWMPCLRWIHPGWLLGFRLFALVVLLLMLVLNVIVDGGTILYFYTQCTFVLLTIYFAVGSLVSMRGCYRYRTSNDVDDHFNTELGFYVLNGTKSIDLRREEARVLAYAFQILFQMCSGAVVLTDIVFWLLIVPFLTTRDYNLNFLIINMHSINAVFLLGDTALNFMSFPWFRIGYFLLYTCVYVIFQWILHACLPLWWPYPFLDLSSAYAPLWYSTVSLMHIPCYGIFFLIMKGKHSVYSKWFGKSYRGVVQ